MSDTPTNTVTISLERLKELEALEAAAKIKKTIEEYDAERLKILREKDKANPSAVTKRTMKHYEVHKDEINARRRAAYKRKKEAEAAAKTPGVSSNASFDEK